MLLSKTCNMVPRHVMNSTEVQTIGFLLVTDVKLNKCTFSTTMLPLLIARPRYTERAQLLCNLF